MTQTVQIHGIIMTAVAAADCAAVAYDRLAPLKKYKEINMTNMSKLICKRSIKPL